MSGPLRSELFKQRTTRTHALLLGSMVGLIALVVVLHMVTIPARDLSDRQGQLKVVGLGTTFGMVFASMLGAMSVTGEIRHGLIRPTFLASPNRSRVLAAKAVASAFAGAVPGFVELGPHLSAGWSGQGSNSSDASAARYAREAASDAGLSSGTRR